MAQESFVRRDIIAIGASSGGIEALTSLVAALPGDLPAALFVVLHVPSQSRSVLPKILSRAGPLRAAHATDNEPILPGRSYIAPPDFHLLLREGHMRIVRGPRENNHRPAIDPLFRSAARVYGRRTVGIVLSGMLDDGAAGLIAIKQAGERHAGALIGGARAQKNQDLAVERFERRIRDAEQQAELIRDLLRTGKIASSGSLEIE